MRARHPNSGGTSWISKSEPGWRAIAAETLAPSQPSWPLTGGRSTVIWCAAAWRQPTATTFFQGIFLKIHAAAGAYDPARPLAPWLFTIVANSVRNHFRDRSPAGSPLEPADDRPDPPDPNPGPECIASARQTLAWLDGALTALPPAQREVLLMVAIVGLRQHDVAQALDLPLNTVKTHLRRARLALASPPGRTQRAARGHRSKAMSKCDEIRERLAQDGIEAAESVVGIKRHLDGCADCTRFRDELERVDAALADLPPEDAPDQLVAETLRAVRAAAAAEKAPSRPFTGAALRRPRAGRFSGDRRRIGPDLERRMAGLPTGHGRGKAGGPER